MRCLYIIGQLICTKGWCEVTVDVITRNWFHVN